MKITFVIQFFILFLYLQCHAQNKKVLDSLNRVYQNAKYDTTKILVLSAIAAEYRISKPDTCITIADKALDMSKKIQYKEGQRVSLYSLGLAHIRKGNYPMALEYFYQSMKLSYQMHDNAGVAGCLQSIGNVYLNEKNYSSALEYYNKAITIREELSDRLEVAGLLNNIAIIYKDMADYPKSLEFSHQSLKLSKEMNIPLYMSHTLRNIGEVKLEQREYDSAIIFFTKSLNIYDYEKNNDKRSFIFLLNSFAKAYQKQGNYDKSNEYAHQSLELAEDIKLLIQVRNIHEILYENYKMKGAYNSALIHHEQFKKINDSLFNVEKAKAIANIESRFLLEKKENELAYIKKEAEAEYLLRLAIQEQNLHKQDSLYILATKARLESENLKIREFGLKIENKAKQLEIEKKRESEILQQKMNYLALFILLIITLFLGHLYKNWRKEKKAKEIIAIQKEEIQLVNRNLENLVKSRTIVLEERNEQLQKYAFYNAHKLRRPIATILGLYNLLQIEDDIIKKEGIFTYLHQMILELDNVVREIQEIVTEKN